MVDMTSHAHLRWLARRDPAENLLDDLVRRARVLAPPHIDRHELSRAAELALVRAALTYDPLRGGEFADHARTRISEALRIASRRAPLRGAPAPRPGTPLAELLQALEDAVAALPPLSRVVMSGFLFEAGTTEELAAAAGVSCAEADVLVAEGLVTLGELLDAVIERRNAASTHRPRRRAALRRPRAARRTRGTTSASVETTRRARLLRGRGRHAS